jgi:hypothetical protein
MIPHLGLKATDGVFCFEFLFSFFFPVLLLLQAFILKATNFSITLSRILIFLLREESNGL